MKDKKPRFLSLFLLYLIIGLTFGIFPLANAADAPPAPSPSSQENLTTESSSEDVTSRGLNKFKTQAGSAVSPGTVAPPTVEATGFKCSPNTGRCNCTGSTDCNYMKDLISKSCGKITCTGSGSSQTCKCTLNGGGVN